MSGGAQLRVLESMVGKKIWPLSSQTPLGADESWESPWRVDDYDHMAVNVATDQIGELIVEFGIIKDEASQNTSLADSDIIRTLSSGTLVPVTVVGVGNGFFRSLVKVPGRAYRVRFVNGSTPQTGFYLHTAAGNGLFPPSTSDDNELLTTVAERERGVFAAASSGDINSTTYAGFIDLSNSTGLPHSRTGRIDLSAVFISVDRDNAATGTVRLGVITRIDGTDSDIEYVQGVAFERSDVRRVVRDRVFTPNQLKCGVVDGSLRSVASQFLEAGVTAVNTGSTLTDAKGNTFTPAVGDLVINYERSAGTYNAAVSCFYHGERTP